MRGSYYDVLGVVPSSSEEEIRARYLLLIRRYHPDHNQSELAHARTAEINEAYRFLSDAALRAAHNAQLAGQRQDVVAARPNGLARRDSRSLTIMRKRSLLRRHAARLALMALVFGTGVAGWQIERRLRAEPAATSGFAREASEDEGRRAVAELNAATLSAAYDMPPVSSVAVDRGVRALRQLEASEAGQLRAFSEQCHTYAADSDAWNVLDSCAAFDQAAFVSSVDWSGAARDEAAYFVDVHDRAAHFYVPRISSMDAIEQRLERIRQQVGKRGDKQRSAPERVIHGIAKRGGRLADAVQGYFDEEPEVPPSSQPTTDF